MLDTPALLAWLVASDYDGNTAVKLWQIVQRAARECGGCSWAAAGRAARHKARLGLQLRELRGAPPDV